MTVTGGISFDKEGLASVATTFGELQAKTIGELDKIVAKMEIIENNWTGPEHDSASVDKASAEENINTAKKTVNEMNESLGLLSSNASKVSYNG